MSVSDQLYLLSRLDDNWDSYGSPAVSPIAIMNCGTVTGRLLPDIDNIELCQSEFGGVEMGIDRGTHKIVCDFGDETFSYYVEKEGFETQYYSFLEYTDDNIKELVNNINYERS